MAVGEACQFESLTGARFTASVNAAAKLPGHDAVTVRVSGRAHYSGKASWTLEEDDEIGRGFLLR
ncbi:Proline racemase [compost metagenome]